MTIVLVTLDGCKVRFDDPDPGLDTAPPLSTYALPLPHGGYRFYDFTGSQRDEDEKVVRVYTERDVQAADAAPPRLKHVRPSGDKLVASGS